MSKRICVLGSKCPKKMASKNKLSVMSPNGSDSDHTNDAETCFFCGGSSASKKSKKQQTYLQASSVNPWLATPVQNTRKRQSNGDIDSLSSWKTKRTSVNRMEELRSKLPIFKKEPEDDVKPEPNDEIEKLNEASFDDLNVLLDDALEPKVVNGTAVKEETDVKPSSASDSGFFDASSTLNGTKQTPSMDAYIPVPSTSRQADSPSFCAQIQVNNNTVSAPDNAQLATNPNTDVSKLHDYEIELLLYQSFLLAPAPEINPQSPPRNEVQEEVSEIPESVVSLQELNKDDALYGSGHIGSGFEWWKKRHKNQIDTPVACENPNVSEHDYSATELKRMMEFNAETIALDTENMHWDDTITLGDSPMQPETIELDDAPMEPTKMQKLADLSKDSPIEVDSDSETNNVVDAILALEHSYGAHRGLDDPQSDATQAYTPPPMEDFFPIVVETKTQQDAGVWEEEIKESAEAKRSRFECVICFESHTGQEVVTTVCGHMFCRECIEAYISTSKKCPTCRSRVTKKKLITIYTEFM